MMAGMLTSRLDRWMRVGAGCGLLLLLVAQQRLCPWLTTAPRDVDECVADAADTKSTTTDEETTKRAIPQLPYVAAGMSAPLPRWSELNDQTTIRRTLGHHDGVQPCGPHVGGSRDLSGDAPSFATQWPVPPIAGPLVLRPQRARRTTVPLIVFDGTICRTGPPLG